MQRLNEEGRCKVGAEERANDDKFTRPGNVDEKNQRSSQFNVEKSNKEDEPEVVDIAEEDEDDDAEEGSEGEEIIVMSDEEDEKKASTDSLVKGLVLNYLKVAVPSLAREFEDTFTVHDTQLQLEEVITAFKAEEEEEEEHEVIDIADEDEDEDAEAGSEEEEVIEVLDWDEDEEIVINPFYQPDPEETDSNEDQLIRGLVHNYLKETLPELAGLFEQSFSSSGVHTHLQLSEVVEHFRKTAVNAKVQKPKRKGAGVGTKDRKAAVRKNRPTGSKINRFSHAEDEVIMEAIANAPDGKIDCNAIAKRLNRGTKSIQMRMESLNLNSGVHRYKNYSQAEDFTILETLILPRLKQGERLSKIVLSNCHFEQLARDLKRRLNSVREDGREACSPAC